MVVHIILKLFPSHVFRLFHRDTDVSHFTIKLIWHRYELFVAAAIALDPKDCLVVSYDHFHSPFCTHPDSTDFVEVLSS